MRAPLRLPQHAAKGKPTGGGESNRLPSGLTRGWFGKTKAALTALAGTIKKQEGYLELQMRDAIRFATDPKHWGSFDLPKPALVSESQVDEVTVNFDTLEYLATENAARDPQTARGRVRQSLRWSER